MHWSQRVLRTLEDQGYESGLQYWRDLLTCYESEVEAKASLDGDCDADSKLTSIIVEAQKTLGPEEELSAWALGFNVS
jgi:hypothetical protein